MCRLHVSPYIVWVLLLTGQSVRFTNLTSLAVFNDYVTIDSGADVWHSPTSRLHGDDANAATFPYTTRKRPLARAGSAPDNGYDPYAAIDFSALPDNGYDPYAAINFSALPPPLAPGRDQEVSADFKQLKRDLEQFKGDLAKFEDGDASMISKLVKNNLQKYCDKGKIRKYMSTLKRKLINTKVLPDGVEIEDVISYLIMHLQTRTPVITFLNSEALQKVLQEGRYKSVYERIDGELPNNSSGHGTMSNNLGARLKTERDLFSQKEPTLDMDVPYPKTWQKVKQLNGLLKKPIGTIRPIYAVLNIAEWPYGDANTRLALAKHGDRFPHFLQYGNQIKQRCTVTYGDTGIADLFSSDPIVADFESDHLVLVLAQMELEELTYLLYVSGVSEPKKPPEINAGAYGIKTSMGYKEVQIHGGVELDDIESIRTDPGSKMKLPASVNRDRVPPVRPMDSAKWTHIYDSSNGFKSFNSDIINQRRVEWGFWQRQCNIRRAGSPSVPIRAGPQHGNGYLAEMRDRNQGGESRPRAPSSIDVKALLTKASK